MATSGPGATNLVTAIADAKLDSIPLVAITGQVGTPVIGTDAFQETPIVEVCRGITKHHYLVTDIKDLARVMKEAFHIATTGRPGPVLVDMPKDIQQQMHAPTGTSRWTCPATTASCARPSPNKSSRSSRQLRREVLEETGLDVEPVRVLDVHSTHFTGARSDGLVEDYHGVHLIFLGRLLPGSEHVEPHVVEVDGSTDLAAWVPRREALELDLLSAARYALTEVSLRR